MYVCTYIHTYKTDRLLNWKARAHLSGSLLSAQSSLAQKAADCHGPGSAMLSGKGSPWPVLLGLMASLCFLLGPALCGSFDRDAVLYLCSDWDAGMRNSAPLVPSQPPGP